MRRWTRARGRRAGAPLRAVGVLLGVVVAPVLGAVVSAVVAAPAAALPTQAAPAAAPPAQAARAATIRVTTATDALDAADGLLSLREAIGQANAAAGPTVVTLAPGTTYALSLCGPDENANANGDLDLVTAEAITIDGRGATIQQTCAGQRIMQSAASAGSLTVTNATLVGGKGADAAVSFAGSLFLTGATVRDNDAGAGAVLGSAAGRTGTSVTLTNSAVGPNTGNGVGITAGTATITSSILSRNSVAGVALVDGTLTATNTLVETNGADGLRANGSASFVLTNSVIRDNGGAGVVCGHCGNLRVTDSAVSFNRGGGISVPVTQNGPTDHVSVSITTSSVVNNAKDGSGGGLGVVVAQRSGNAPAAQIWITRSTFAGNTAAGAQGRGGGIFAETGEVRVSNSTLVANTAAVSGGAMAVRAGDVFLDHVTVVENTAPVGANVTAGAALHAFASIVSAGSGAGADCAVSGATVSGDHNVGGDGSCAFTGPDDHPRTGDPLLGPLRNNGGTTLTRLPLSGSPALGAVPAKACTGSTVDQRGTPRPQGVDCEAGATEVALDGSTVRLPATGTRVGHIVLIGLSFVVYGVVVRVAARRRPVR